MQITSIEVIRGNPGIAAEVVVGERIELSYGDTLKVDVSFDYRGSAQKVTLYGAVGVRYPAVGPSPSWFDEKVVGEEQIDLPDSFEFAPQTASVDIPITSDISPGTDYDLYVKLLEYPEAGMPEIDDVIDIIGIPPVYELVYEHEYPEAKTYVGKAEECTAMLTIPLPDQFFPNNWVVAKIASTFAEELAKEGGEMLDVKVYEDATPTWHTNYRIVATAHASPFPWAVVIPLILAIILVVAFIKLVVEFKEIDWGEIPTPIPWAILAVAGGVAVLGVAVALAMPRRSEGHNPGIVPTVAAATVLRLEEEKRRKEKKEKPKGLRW